MNFCSIHAYIVSCLLLSFLRPLYSDPQASYWSPYELHKSEYHPFSSYNSAVLSSENFPLVSRHEVSKSFAPENLHLESNSRIDSVKSPSVKEVLKEETQKVEDANNRVYYEYNLSPSVQNSKEDNFSIELSNTTDMKNSEKTRKLPENVKRITRQAQKQKPGFFWTLARVTYETFNDTKSAIQQISKIVGESISPDEPSTKKPPMSGALVLSNVTTTTENSSNQNVTTEATTTTTTEEPYKLTRSGLQSLIRRNLKGLVRLFNIEWNDALNQSDITTREFRKQLSNQVGMYLQDNPDAY